MVKEYLLGLRNEALDNKIQLENKLSAVATSIKEDEAFLSMLEVGTDEFSSAFTPHTIESTNRDRVEEIQKRLSELYAFEKDLNNQIYKLQVKIDDLSAMIKMARVSEYSYTTETKLSDDEKLKFKILEIQEAERQRIARELHDSTVQSMTGVLRKLELSKKLSAKDPVKGERELKEANQLLKNTIAELRNLIYDLRPVAFDDSTIAQLLQSEIDRLKKEHQVPIELQVPDNVILPSVVSLSLLRIVKEACSNSVKHGDATLIRVRLQMDDEDGGLIFEVLDNGKGFKEDNSPKLIREDNTGNGLSMMRERVYLLSGSLEYVPRDKGTLLRVTIPYNSLEKEKK